MKSDIKKVEDLKGQTLGYARVGAAEVSDRHANFIVAGEGATSDEVLKLIDLVREQVLEKLGVELELEIEVW